MSTGPSTGPGTGPDAGLSARLGVDLGRFDLDVDLEVAPGEVVALLGPNGAGKSTTLRALAGLVALTSGRIEVSGAVLDDATTGRFVAPQHRRVGMVFQDHLLFGHLSLLENVAFGLRSRGTPRREARDVARRWLDVVGLGDLAGVRPGAVSGGQAQRVALARALATAPDLLLLDEPLSALDAGTRLAVRSELRRHLAAFEGVTVIVTHDALDAMVLADRLVVVEQGRVVQTGAPADVARAPRTDYVARLVGLNLYRGTSSGTDVAVDGGGTLVTGDPVEGPAFVAFPPTAVALHRARPEGSPRNAWPGRVVGTDSHGDVVRVRLDGAPPVLADVTAAAVADLGLEAGQEVWAAVKATEVRSYPA